MRVRVFDPSTNTWFFSPLYAVFFSGIFEQWLVVENGCLTLWKKYNADIRPQISAVDPEFPGDWITLTNGDIADFPDFPKHLPEDRWTAFRGYPWVWEDRETVRALLSDNTVPLEETRFGEREVFSPLPGWRYVSTQAEADHLMDQAGGFHDAVLAELRYVSGSRRTEEGMVVSDHIRQVTMLFHSLTCPPLELVFEGVVGLDLRPAGEDVCASLLDATLRVRNAAVFFCDGDCGEDEASYPGTKILAYSLRWRFLPPDQSSFTSK